MLKRLLLILSAVAVAGSASAQDFFHRPSPIAGRTLLTISLFEEVRAELKTTTDENSKVDALLEKLQGEIQEAISGANGDFSSVQGTIEKINAKYDDECLKILTADQGTRLKQIFVQFNGAGSITNTIVAKDLAITDEQKPKIKKIQDDQRQKMMETFQQGGSPEEAQKAFKKLQDDLAASLEKVLTDDQKAKLKDLAGAKFEFKKVEGI